MLLDISRLISTANEMAPGCHCCATIEQQKSLILWDVRNTNLRPREKAWITGSIGSDLWSASNTDCQRLQVIIWQMLHHGFSPFPTAQVYTSQPMLSSSLRGRAGLGCWYFFPVSPHFSFQTPPFSRGKKNIKKPPNQSTIHHKFNWFQYKLRALWLHRRHRKPIHWCFLQVAILVWGMLLFLAGS